MKRVKTYFLIAGFLFSVMGPAYGQANTVHLAGTVAKPIVVAEAGSGSGVSTAPALKKSPSNTPGAMEAPQSQIVDKIKVTKPEVKSPAATGIMPVLFDISSLQFYRMAQDTFLWQATIRNRKAEQIKDVRLMVSKMINGSWVPAGTEINIDKFSVSAEKKYNGTWQGQGASSFKLDILVKNEGSYQLNASKTLAFNPAQALDMVQNLSIDSVTATPFGNGRWRWEATVTNNNPVAFTDKLSVQGKLFSDNKWRDCSGSSYTSISPGETKTTSVTFWRDTTATQLKVIIEAANGDDVKESEPVRITPITVSVEVNNPVITRSSSVANWSASILSSSSDTLYDIKVKTYHRSGNGSWAQASNQQALASLVPGTALNVNGIFTPGSSNQFKIEIEYHSKDDVISTNVYAIAAAWQGSF